MKLIVGLGNPGKKYSRTRHNAGFMAVDSLAEEANAEFRKKLRSKSLVAQTKLCDEKIILVKPQTYMNLSGHSVRVLLKANGLTPEDLIVVVDDKDLKLGQIRLREQGGSGGHNGLKSISEQLQTDSFPRVRIGVRGEGSIEDTAEYVLSDFLAKEIKVINEVLDVFNQMIHCVVEEDFSKAMSLYNKVV